MLQHHFICTLLRSFYDPIKCIIIFNINIFLKNGYFDFALPIKGILVVKIFIVRRSQLI